MALSASERQKRYMAKLHAKAAGNFPPPPPLVDPSTCDPKRVLQEIAVGKSYPAGARVAAARALLALEETPPGEIRRRTELTISANVVARALASMAADRRPN